MTLGYLGGCALLGDVPATWTLTEGVTPHSAVFSVTREDAKKLLAGKLTPVTLSLGGTESVADFKNLYVVQEVEPEVPQLARVLVTDRRWFWTMRQMRLGFNVRRKLGVKYLETPTSVGGPRQVIPTIGYAPWSLKDSTTPWTAETVFAEMQKWLVIAEKDAAGQEPEFVTLASAKTKLSDMPIENLILEGDTAACLAQVLDYMPGMGVLVDASGIVKFFNKTDASEASMLKALGPPKVGRGVARPVSLARIRPSQIQVLFARECELMFKGREDPAGTTTDQSSDDLTMENVLPIPDATLTVNGRTLSKGTWITIQEALTAWGAAPYIKGARPITMADLQRGSVPFNGFIEALTILGTTDAGQDWASRATCAVEHYRRTYRINKRWMDRIFQLKASRVGTLDFTTGARGDSPVLSDFAYQGTTRSLYHDRATGKALDGGKNCPRYDGGDLSATANAAPGRVEVVDHDQGIIHLNFYTDLAHVYGTVFPSQVVANTDTTSAGTLAQWGGPSADIRDPKKQVGWDVLTDPKKFPRLLAAHRVAVVLTAQPGMGGYSAPAAGGAPTAQFYREGVNPSDCGDFAGKDDCRGPVLQVLIGAGYETARTAWSDDATLKQEIKACFGVGKSNGTPILRTITLNAGQRSIGGASLPDIANAVGRRIYSMLADRVQGSASGTLVPSIEIRGWLGEVAHSLDPSGEVSTSMTFPDRIQPQSLENYLSTSTRLAVLKLANQGG